MKIQLERNDLEKILKAFLPSVKYADGKLLFHVGKSTGNSDGEPLPNTSAQPSAKTQTVELEDTELTMRSRVRYQIQADHPQKLSGDLDLSVRQDGSVELILKMRDLDHDIHLS